MPHANYELDGTMRAARARYFEANAFGADGGYDDAWVHLKVGPLPVSFPHTRERVRAVRYHDLHHVVTGYDTDLIGEFEISAWELGAGCKDFWAAWFLNLAGVAAGVDGLFMEVHENPARALSDGPNAYRLGRLRPLLQRLLAIHDARRRPGR